MNLIKTQLCTGLILFILGGFFIQKTSAQTPKYSNEFLSLGVGARSLGMGNSMVSISNDATSTYWNPAGLTQIESKNQFGLMHASYFAGISNYDYGSIVLNSNESSYIGFSFIRFGVDNIPNTTGLIDQDGNINYDNISSFSSTDNAFFVSYARKTSIENLSFGMNIKIIRRTVGDFAGSWGFGLDAGLQYQVNNWHFGLMCRDITSSYNAWSYHLSDEMKAVYQQTGNDIPINSYEITLPRIIPAIAYNLKISEKIHLLTSLDLNITTDGKRNVLLKSSVFSLDPSIGIELNYNKLIYLRAGINNIQQETDSDNNEFFTLQPNIGLGINIKDRVMINYAYTDIGDVSIALYSNIFSLTFNLKNNSN